MSRGRTYSLDSFQQFTAINVLLDPGVIGGPVVIPNGIRIIIRWNLANGKVARNVLGGLVAGGFNPTTAVAQAIYAGISTGGTWTALAAQLSTTTFIAGVDLLDIRAANLPLVSSTGAPVPGTAAGAPHPSETSLVVTLRTGRTGPSGRGRLYMPPFSQLTQAVGDFAGTTTVTAVQNWAANVQSVLSGQSITPALALPARAAYTGISGTAHPARAASMLPITSSLVRDNHWDSQRRRGLK
jgi:hypothetical protein